MADLGLLITKPFVIQQESSSVDLDLQDTINCAAGRTAPALLIRGSAVRNESATAVRETAPLLSSALRSPSKPPSSWHFGMKTWPLCYK